MRTQTVRIYQFSELSDSAKETARQWYRENGFDYQWWDCTVEDIKTALEIIGFYDLEIFFSGFYSQGDGACFIGRYSYEKGALKRVKSEYPQWQSLHTLVEQLQLLNRQYFYTLSFGLEKICHRYQHENTVSVSYVERDDGKEITDDNIFDEIEEITRDFMCEIYRMLESEYEYLISDDQVDEAITANGYEFTENGDFY